MGVLVAVLGDGRMQLVHNAAHAQTPQDAQEGLLFMQVYVKARVSLGIPPYPLTSDPVNDFSHHPAET